MTQRRRRWAARTAAAVGLVAVLAVPSAPGRAQEAPEAQEPAIGGFVLTGAASGAEVIYDQPGAFVTNPTAQGEAPFSTTTLSTGPAGTALASLAWPGPLAADFGTAAEQNGAPPGFGEQYNYKVRSQAASPQGPADHSNDGVPGVTMRTHADGDEALSTAQANKAAMPGFVETGSLASSARSFLDDQGHGVAEATGTASGISVAGVVKIDSVVSVARAKTDGVTATVEGQTTVNGLTIADQRAVVDESGPHPENADGAAGSAVNSTMQRALAQSGITIRLAGSSEHVDGATGERVVGGLVISVTAKEPDQRTVTYTFGGALASVTATPGFGTTDGLDEFDFGLEEEVLDTGGDETFVASDDLSAPSDDSFAGDTDPPAAPRARTGAAAPPAETPAAVTPIGYTSGVPFGAVVAVLVGAGALGLAFRRLADDVLTQQARACLIDGGQP